VLALSREQAKQIGKQLFRFTKCTDKIFPGLLTDGGDMDR
jgi:hypothetical protein